MALRVWLLLNGTLENKGISNYNIIKADAVTFSANGKIGQCATAASSANITLTMPELSTFFGDNKTYSLACWVKVVGTATNGWFIKFGSNSCGLWWAKSAPRWVWNENDNGKRCANETISNDTTNWHHLTITVDKTVSGKITTKQYVDGTLAASYPGSTFDNPSTKPTGTTITINPYIASVNDVRIYDHCLSAAEVHEISQGLVLHYKLDDITNGIQDSSGYGHNGTIVNTPSLVTSQARYTSNIHFSANNQHIQLPAITYSNFGNSFTIAWWGKRSTHSNMMFWGFSDGNRLNGMYNGTLWNTGDGSNNPIYKPGTTTTITAPTATSWHHYVMVGNGTKSQLYVDGILYGEAKTYKGLTGTSIWINGWRNHTEYSSTDMDISDFRIYCTALSADDILSLYHTAAKVNNLGGLHTFEFQEKGPNKIYKTGITQGQEISEINGMSNLKYDPNVYIEPDGSAWVRIFHHVNPTSNKFASSDTFTTGVYKDENRWFNFDLCNYVNSWEFIAAVTRTNTDTLERYRWIQSVNPFTATFDQTKVANITRITTGYNTSPLGGLYHVSGSAWFAANNGTNNNWFGATGCWSAWNGGIPGWKSTSASDAITTGTIDIYLRIDNIETTMPTIAKSTKNNIWLGRQLIER